MAEKSQQEEFEAFGHISLTRVKIHTHSCNELLPLFSPPLHLYSPTFHLENVPTHNEWDFPLKLMLSRFSQTCPLGNNLDNASLSFTLPGDSRLCQVDKAKYTWLASDLENTPCFSLPNAGMKCNFLCNSLYKVYGNILFESSVLITQENFCSKLKTCRHQFPLHYSKMELLAFAQKIIHLVQPAVAFLEEELQQKYIGMQKFHLMSVRN